MCKYTTDATDGPAPEVLQSLDELAREGARRMIAAALQLEADEYVERLRDARDAQGRALVVRNGRARERKVTVGAGTITIRAPRVDDGRPGPGLHQQDPAPLHAPLARRG
jgi:transposase-like protein